MLLKPFTYHSPKSLDETLALLTSHNNLKICAGGTFLITNLKTIKKNNKQGPEHVLSLKHIKDLKGITYKDNVLSIGAMTTMQEIIDSKDIQTHFPILIQLAKSIGSTPIRHMATVGGNIASRYVWTEWPTVLLACDAKLLFNNTENKEEPLSIPEYLKNNASKNSLLTKIVITKEETRSINYQRVARSTTLDLPLISVCISARIDNKQFNDPRISISNGSQYATRDEKLESFLNEPCNVAETFNNRNIDLYGSQEHVYKQHMFEVSIKKALAALLS